MSIKVSITYDVTSPESAEHGDFHDHGFYGPGGWKYSIADEHFYGRVERDGRDKALADMTPEPHEFEDAEEAVDFIAAYGPFEPSCYPPCTNGHCWVTQTDGDTDYGTGENTRLSFHVDAANEVQAEIIRQVSAG